MAKPRNKVILTASMLDRNAIVRGLDKESEQLILAKCELVHLVLRQPIYAPEEPITDVYFPIDAIISIVSRMHDGQQIEIGTIGREGMSAFPLLMGASSTANESFCQVPGAAVRMPTAVFRALNASNNVMRQRLDRYLQAYVNMLGQLAACNRLHSIYERCSRWLLMSRDRVNTDDIELTHEYLAMMLGTGRSGVTIAASTLQRAGFIHYARGVITIVDRLGLESATCECYEVARRQFGGLLRDVDATAPN